MQQTSSTKFEVLERIVRLRAMGYRLWFMGYDFDGAPLRDSLYSGLGVGRGINYTFVFAKLVLS